MRQPTRLLLVGAAALGLAACAPLAREARGRAVAHALRVRHPGLPTDEPLACTLLQINDAEGFPSEYRMTVQSVICPEQTCRISAVGLVWDALGHYQRFELPPGEALEKALPAEPGPRTPGAAAAWRAAPFTAADTLKLDAILRDADSLLGRQKLPDVVRLHGTGEVDGITGATPAAVRDAVVAGASLTCYSLWHWAHGEAAAAARELTHRQCGEALLLRFLASDRPHYARFALEHLRLHRLFGPDAVRAVEAALRGGGSERLDLGLAYLREALPERERYLASVADLVLAGAGEARAYLLDRLAAEPELPPAVLDAISAGLPRWDAYYEIHLFLQLAARRGPTPTVVAQAARLLDSPNFFIARRAHAFLRDQPALDAPTRSRLQAFRDQAARDGRSL